MYILYDTNARSIAASGDFVDVIRAAIHRHYFGVNINTLPGGQLEHLEARLDRLETLFSLFLARVPLPEINAVLRDFDIVIYRDQTVVGEV